MDPTEIYPCFYLRNIPRRLLLLPKWKSDSRSGSGFSQNFDSGFGSKRKTQNPARFNSGSMATSGKYYSPYFYEMPFFGTCVLIFLIVCSVTILYMQYFILIRGNQSHFFDSCPNSCSKKVTPVLAPTRISLKICTLTPVCTLKTCKQCIFCLRRQNRLCKLFCRHPFQQVMSWFQCWQAVRDFLSTLHYCR